MTFNEYKVQTQTKTIPKRVSNDTIHTISYKSALVLSRCPTPSQDPGP